MSRRTPIRRSHLQNPINPINPSPDLFFAINNGWKSPFNDLWLGNATWLGNGWVTFPLAIVALFFLDRERFGRNLVVLTAAGIVGGIALNLLKNAFHTPRPLQFYADDITAGRVYVNVMFERLYENSMPSGHTQTAFTVATVLLWVLSKARKLKLWNGSLIVLMACAVGLSRVYVGAHFPVDVVAGAGVGVLSGVVGCLLVAWISKEKMEQ